MNTSLDQQQAALPPNYCVLPSQHSHSFPTDFLELFELDDNEEDSIVSALTSPRETTDHNNDNQQADYARADSAALINAASVTDKTSPTIKQQLLDPYIDAVQVKTRINNKRGARVKAAHNTMGARDHEPHPSYYSKTVHVVEEKEDAEEWDLSDLDDHDEHEKYDHHHHGKKKKVYVKKKKHPKKKKKGRHHHHYHSGHKHYHHGKKKRKKKQHHNYKGKKGYHPKKKTYAYVYLSGKDDHHGKHDYDHDDDDHHDQHDKYGKHGHYHHHHKKSGKLVHLDMMDKSKWGVAGLLGYTLLCVNYLLVLQQPTYDKYTGRYYTKYSPHGGKGDMVELKSGGPVILAHCGEIPEPRGLVKAASAPSNLSVATRPSLGQIERNSSSSFKVEPAASGANYVTGEGLKLNALEGNSAHSPSSSAASPPAYYYTLSPSSYSGGYGSTYDSLDDHHYDDQYTTMRSNGLLSPIQYYLNRLLLPTSSYSSDYNSDEHDYSPIQVVGSPPSSRYTGSDRAPRKKIVLKTSANPLAGDLRHSRLTGGALVATRGRLGGLNGRLVLVDGQPQVVGTKDNLVDMRTRQVEILMHVTRRRFTGAQQLVNLNDEDEWRRGPVDGLGVQVPVAVRPPSGRQPLVQTDNGRQRQQGEEEDRMQADEPDQNGRNERNNNNNGNRSPSDNQILDLPDYALSGDSIELTCNHRVPVHRLYSVKWFKDSLEFYRFIPANGPRMKSSLHLQDVRLDLGRSNSETLYLRNVTHRTSGLYRCEVVSEGPNFETLSGEKRMQVYALPDSGPQLRLLEAGEIPAGLSSPTPPPLAPLTLSVGQVRPSTLLVTRPTVPDNSDEYNTWPGGNLERLNDGLQQSASGPIIRCLSARSSPVAQMRFFINNQPVGLSRTLENSTTSYSDGTESNMVSFRLALPDFTLTDDNNASLDRAASLKSNSSQSDLSPKQSQGSTTTTTTTTTSTTTTTTTARPNPGVAKSKDKSKTAYANENVQFDDHNAPMKANDFKIAPAKAAKLATSADKRHKTGANVNKESANKQNNQKKRKLKKPNTTDDEQKRAPATVPTRTSLDRDLERPTNTDRNQVDEDEEESVVSPLPADPDKANRKRELAESSIDLEAKSALANYSAMGAGVRRKRAATTSLVDSANYKLAGSAGLSEAASQFESQKDDQGRPQYKRPATSGPASPSGGPASRTGASGGGGNGEPNQGRLSRQEQRVRATAGNRDDTNEGQTEQLYSNYIRIKCTSLVPAVGYEMTSELSVPLTVLVPARQISDAFRQSQLAAGQSPGTSSAGSRDDTSSRRGQQQRQRRPNGSNEAFFGPSRFSGNSLQAPRAVLIDRLAQASGPAGKMSVRAEPYPSTTTAPNQGQSSSVKGMAAPILRNGSNPNGSHDRARYLEELTRKRDKAASNGSALSSLGITRSLLNSVRPGTASRVALVMDSILAILTSIPYQMTIPLITGLWLAI